jgi:chorismate dehydratase
MGGADGDGWFGLSKRRVLPPVSVIVSCPWHLFLEFPSKERDLGLRISLVNYLNAAPLGWFFMNGPSRHEYQVIPATPAMCAEQLASGEVDIGLIPAIEYQRIPDLRIIPHVAIAASNEVRSVLLVRSRECTTMRTVALDTSSRTSVALIRLLLNIRMGIRPEFIPHEPEISEMLKKHDAALIIGDAALKCSTEQYEIIDLAAAWRDWQGKPFVFAFWACRSEAAIPGNLVEVFVEAKKWGLARIQEIASCYSRILDLSPEFLENYLRYNLDHNMGPEHIEGLERFYRLAFQSGLIENLRPIDFLK